jgi:hypothetical protein
MNWIQLWTHYDEIKTKHNLISSDVFKQLAVKNYHSYLRYLSKDGYKRTPSNKQGTVGKRLQDILNKGLSKTDWSESTATYEDKLRELYLYELHAHVMSYDAAGRPIIQIYVVADIWGNISENELIHTFTIDGIIPKIGELNRLQYLIMHQ